MNKSDKYYLKKGKLELSMLDEDDDFDDYSMKTNTRVNTRTKTMEERLSELDLQHTKRLRGAKKTNSSNTISKVKVSKEIYSTLQAMGQYLTKADENGGNSLPVKKPINSAKAQMLEELASRVKVQDISLPPMPSQEERLKNTIITKADEIKEVSEDICLTSVKQEDNQSESVTKDCEQPLMAADEVSLYDEEIDYTDRIAGSTSRVSGHEPIEQMSLVSNEVIQSKSQEVIEEVEDYIERNVLYSPDMEKEVEKAYMHLQELKGMPVTEDEMAAKRIKLPILEYKDEHCIQEEIDHLVESFFDRRVPQYSYIQDLKRHVDKHIKVLEQME